MDIKDIEMILKNIQIPTILEYCLIGIGIITSIVLISFICVTFIKIIIDMIQTIIYNVKRKHRFKKKPIAKCYCIDCESWNKETHECTACFKPIQTFDNWFCGDAIPRKRKK